MTSSSSPSLSSTLFHHHHLILTIITTTTILAFCAFWHLAMQYRRWRRIISVQNLTKLKSILYSCSFCIKRAQEKSLEGCIWDKNCTTLCALSESNDHWIKHQDFGQMNGEGYRTKHGNKYIMIVSAPCLISATKVMETFIQYLTVGITWHNKRDRELFKICKNHNKKLLFFWHLGWNGHLSVLSECRW